MMWNGRDDRGEVLKRIVLILVSLAGLAIQAANAPRPLRRYVLGLLRAAELAALSLLVDVPFSSKTAIRWLEPDDDSAEGAILIAFRLRLLALAIAQIAKGDRLSTHPACVVPGWMTAAQGCSKTEAFARPAYADTS